jgi:hypothetical protein
MPDEHGIASAMIEAGVCRLQDLAHLQAVVSSAYLVVQVLWAVISASQTRPHWFRRFKSEVQQGSIDGMAE